MTRMITDGKSVGLSISSNLSHLFSSKNSIHILVQKIKITKEKHYIIKY